MQEWRRREIRAAGKHQGTIFFCIAMITSKHDKHLQEGAITKNKTCSRRKEKQVQEDQEALSKTMTRNS